MRYYWETIDSVREETHEDGLREWQIDYSQEVGMYRVSEFLNSHFQNEIVFDEYKPPIEDGFGLITDLEQLKVGYKFLSEKEMSYNTAVDSCIAVVAEWLKKNGLIDEVDY